ncbi:MAG: hypothetical protein KDA42_09860 [Planctomycetales bacterium]|nr:hypothetical protein [Planctomycetales bacterium]
MQRIILTALGLMCCGISAAQVPNATPARQTAEAPRASSAKSEALALAFVGKNHPELAAILPRLKKQHPKEYASAIRDLSGSQQRLAKLAERDQESHAVELRIWQIDSRVRLLAAQLAMGGDRDTLVEQIREAFTERQQLERKRKERQRELLQAKIKKLDAEIAHAAERSDQRVEQAVSKILASVDKAAGRDKRPLRKGDTDKSRESSSSTPNEPTKKQPRAE